MPLFSKIVIILFFHIISYTFSMSIATAITGRLLENALRMLDSGCTRWSVVDRNCRIPFWAGEPVVLLPNLSQSLVNYFFEYFAKVARESYRTVVGGFRAVFSRFHDS